MAVYDFLVDSFFIKQIRSGHEDTLFGSSALIVYNEQGALHQDWGAKSQSYGNLGAGGNHPAGLSFLNVDVPGPSPQYPDGGSVAWTFALLNSGGGNPSGVINVLENVLTDFAGAVAGKALDASSPLLSFADFLDVVGIESVKELVSLLTANCDGPVASGQFLLTAANLVQEGILVQEQDNPGTPSPGGCGANSDYVVKYTIGPAASPPIPPPSGA